MGTLTTGVDKKYYDAASSALATWRRANEALTEAEDGGQGEAVIAARQAELDQAKAAHTEAAARVTRQEELAEARAGLPVRPNSEDPGEERGESEEERWGKDPDAPMNRVGVTPATPKRGWNPVTMHVGGEPATYQGGFDSISGVLSNSWFLDSLSASKGDSEAIERIIRSGRELADAGKPMAMKRRMDGIREILSERAIAETAGSGGELVAPLYLQEEYLKLLRAARAYVDLMRKVPLPPSTNTINIPRLKGGTTTAAQSDLGTVSDTNLETALLTFHVITVAGQEDFARQLFDRSVPELADQVVFPDLIAEYLANTDREALEGSGTLPHAKGVTELTYSTTATTYGDAHEVTFTSASPKLYELYKKIANAVQQIHTTRFMPPTAIIMHPRRWAWIITQYDSQERPLVVPTSQGPFNVYANLDEVAAEGAVGSMQGLPVFVDPNIPTNLGASTNQDPIIVQKMDDSWFMEDDPIKTRVFEEVLSNELAIRAQVFNYLALTHERYVKGVAKIVGTGMVEPTF